MKFPWFRVLNLVLDVLGAVLRERVNGQVEKRADAERANMKAEHPRKGE